MHVWGGRVFINVGASNTDSIFWEAILLLEVQLMLFLNVWDVFLGNTFPICACRKINVGCCDFVRGRMGCYENGLRTVCVGYHIRKS